MVTEDYVSFEVAKLLKEKGFDGVCRYYYPDSHTNLVSYVDCRQYDMFNNESCIAPTLQMACKWLREVHNIQIIVFRYNNSAFPYIWYIFGHNKEKPQKANSYEEAVEAAIKYCLENLI